MLSQHDAPIVFLKRRMEARDYFLNIPAARVNLDKWVMAPTAEQEFHHRRAVGLDAMQCGAVACLAGWLWTMPSYQDWVKTSTAYDHHDSAVLLERYLGVQYSGGSSMTERPFTCRVDLNDQKAGDKTDYQLAVERLEALVAEAEAACGR
jgi:hypothetical protein